MKREDVKNKIPGITDEQLNWIMQENGADINREKSAATALQAQLDNANAQLKTAQDGLKAFEGVDVAGLQEQVTKLKADMKAQAEGFAFDNALDTAILGRKGRSVFATFDSGMVCSVLRIERMTSRWRPVRLRSLSVALLLRMRA